jgi:hypothetical protein
LGDGDAGNWKDTTLLDLLMHTRNEPYGLSFQRDAKGRPTAIIVVGHTQEAVAAIEQAICLNPD